MCHLSTQNNNTIKLLHLVVKVLFVSSYVDSFVVIVVLYTIWCCVGPCYDEITPHSWLRHQMETFSALLAICAGNSPVSGEVPAQRPVTRIFDVFFDLRLNKPMSKQWWGWWFETLSRPLWRHCNVTWKDVSVWFDGVYYVSLKWISPMFDINQSGAETGITRDI